jgi:hypothetical protein
MSAIATTAQIINNVSSTCYNSFYDNRSALIAPTIRDGSLNELTVVPLGLGLAAGRSTAPAVINHVTTNSVLSSF